MAEMTAVDFWFDPACPWAWMTSRWMDEVTRQRPEVEAKWHVMSLFLLNKDQQADPEYLASHDAAHQRSYAMTKVIAGVMRDESLGNAAVKRLYDELGQRIHLEGRTDDAVLAEAAEAAGIPQELLDRAAAGEFDEALQASHDEGIGRVGQDVGTPIVAVDGTAFFGPVISPAAKGEDALRLFDGVVMAASYPGFFELKRSRTVGPQFD